MHKRELRASGERPDETRLEIRAFMDEDKLVCQLVDKKRPHKYCVQVVEQIQPWVMEERGLFSEEDPAYPLVIKQAIDAMLRRWFQYQAQESNEAGY